MESTMMHMIAQPLAVVRKNHALEHATLQVLAAKHTPSSRLLGYSDPGGFWVVGTVDTEALTIAAQEALQRLQGGEAQLAIHPNCGTNLATSGFLAGTAAWLAMAGTKKGFRNWLDRFPLVVTMVTMALMIAQPLGLRMQAVVTTDAKVNGLKIIQVTKYDGRMQPVHRVSTHFGA